MVHLWLDFHYWYVGQDYTNPMLYNFIVYRNTNVSIHQTHIQPVRTLVKKTMIL